MVNVWGGECLGGECLMGGERLTILLIRWFQVDVIGASIHHLATVLLDGQNIVGTEYEPFALNIN